MIVGMVGGFITCITMPALDRLHIDDPVGAAATHGSFNFINILNFYKFLSIVTINTRIHLKYRRKWYLGSYCYRFIC